jgi:hypothetical protein
MCRRYPLRRNLSRSQHWSDQIVSGKGVRFHGGKQGRVDSSGRCANAWHNNIRRHFRICANKLDEVPAANL